MNVTYTYIYIYMYIYIYTYIYIYISTKSAWNPPKGHPSLEVFLSQVENEFFDIPNKI